MSWRAFELPEFSFTDFAAGSRVLDVGSGPGDQLAALLEKGVEAIGLEPGAADAARSRARGHVVVRGTAERIPLAAASFDGVLCKVVLPYTDERRAIAEFARVLRPGGRCVIIGHGAGYYLRYLAEGPGLKFRFYALRTLANTAVYRLLGRRIPGWIGDSIHQSPARLARLCRRNGLRPVVERRGSGYRALPVFIYQVAVRE